MIAPLHDERRPEPDLYLVLDALQDALIELEVWRQHAHATEEWSALRRMAAALGAAHQEVFGCVDLSTRSSNSEQGILQLG